MFLTIGEFGFKVDPSFWGGNVHFQLWPKTMVPNPHKTSISDCSCKQTSFHRKDYTKLEPSSPRLGICQGRNPSTFADLNMFQKQSFQACWPSYEFGLKLCEIGPSREGTFVIYIWIQTSDVVSHIETRLTIFLSSAR